MFPSPRLPAGAGVTAPDAERDFARLRWRCRRGLLELDLVLTRFLDSGYAALNSIEREAFLQLLDCGDHDLWDLLSGRREAADPVEKSVVDRLRTV
ncbi:MAG: succinate dehydrogenase assembly factor 2 [Burkholderiales bacterium]|nr:succinate dehydrogenase assembly factor 2 [Burkholderiales bacterium]